MFEIMVARGAVIENGLNLELSKDEMEKMISYNPNSFDKYSVLALNAGKVEEIGFRLISEARKFVKEHYTYRAHMLVCKARLYMSRKKAEQSFKEFVQNIKDALVNSGSMSEKEFRALTAVMKEINGD